MKEGREGDGRLLGRPCRLSVPWSRDTPGVRTLSLNCLFAGRNNNKFDLCVVLPGIN